MRPNLRVFYASQRLMDRLVNCISSEEQCEALQGMSQLVSAEPSARDALREIGFQHILSVIRTERDDFAALSLSLEVLLAAVGSFSGK